MFCVSIGCRILRLDAVAFLWKEIGTNCLHLPKTHEIIKLIRNFVGVAPTLILTEQMFLTKCSYFGKVMKLMRFINFLSPLLLHGLLNGTAEHITKWADGLEALPKGCHF